jgi:hypothetical protein
MEDRPVPYSWEGRQVVASIVEAGGSNPHTYAPYPLEAPERTGILEKVTELGILASLETGTEEEDVSIFYPWGAVLHLRLPRPREHDDTL